MATTTVTGVQEAMAKLRKIGEEGERIASREVVASALNIQARARAMVPRRSGDLGNSIVVGETEDDIVRNSPAAANGGIAQNTIRSGMLGAVVGSHLIYARAQHWGTRHHSGTQYLFNPSEEERKRFLGNLQAALRTLERA